MNPATALALAAADGSTVTVVDGDRVNTGTVAEHPTIPNIYAIRPLGRARAYNVMPDDVAEVIFE
ncbi:RNA binding protein [Arthrobacter phage CallinAllBarbz]|uniref:RNA binding protein n=1 Tax=Arthrobacter phage CallinAllBarbz TaxID=3077790 RepID=A0AA96K9Z4_9CAUD|nr:RNA binding protein [Arthrobacter phage CallinAllBarbz]